MFAGKTSEIQSVVRRYKCLEKPVLVLTADIDTRFLDPGSAMAVVSHDRTSVPARAVDVNNLLMVFGWTCYKEATAIVIDEAQFFKGLFAFVKVALQDGKHLTVVGLDSDAEQQPFGEVLAIGALADSIEKKTALCKRCGDGTEAIFTRALGSRTGQVEVGGAELYEPVCRRHYHA